jgi:sigma-B regulation protein RsbU (phosphoserine phosphatase)
LSSDVPGRLGAPPPPLDDVACALLTTDAKGMILYANQTFYTWLGMEKEDLVGQKRFQDLLTMGGRIFHQTHWAPLLQMQGSVSEVKLEVKSGDGTVLPMLLNAVRRERAGAVVHDLAMFVARDRDIYERELLASREDLRLLVQEATRLQEEAKDRALFAEQMVGIVSHDLRNPLSAIHLGLLALSRGELTSNQVRVLGRISRSTERAHRLITDLLDFTAARVGKGLAVKIGAIDLHAVVAEALDELRTAYPDRQIEHLQHGAGSCSADPDRIAQALGNLVSNAIAYGEPGGPVSVSSQVGAAECTVEVHNFGPPIPQDALPTLFQPMVRGAVGGAARSVGLGLYIVREISLAHGGDVAVRSSAEEGTTFTMYFANVTSAMRA